MSSSALPGDVSSKIGPEHLERRACIYVRQSSMMQVEHHLESKRRQYDLVQRAAELGWSRERIVVIDQDQGKSGAIAGSRDGFGALVASVGRGEVGAVFSLEASRLARNSPDWHNLIYLCRWTNTLIVDENGIHDPSSSSDRMMLGFRGQFAEMELDTSIRRMVEARWTKARRGEFLIIPPAGYDIDDAEQVVMTCDEAVRTAVRTVFEKFDELGTARQVFVWWKENGMKFPVRRNIRTHPIVWMEPHYRMVRSVLRNPIYAGVYAFGRSKMVREIDADDPTRLEKKTKQVPREDWPVLIRDHHPGYVTYEKHLEILERIRSNAVMDPNFPSTSSGQGPAREGRALLQGLARCGHCGRNMLVNYGGRRGSLETVRTLQYRCSRARQESASGKDCQLIGGKKIDELVAQAFLQMTARAGVAAAVRAAETMQRESAAIEQHWKLQVEQATYEVQRAERQYNAAEPENRLVARELERRWNERLTALDAVRTQAENARARQRPLSEEEVKRAHELGSDLESLWHAASTTNRDKKRLVRCAIEEIQLRTEEKRCCVRIVWKGGLTTDHEVQRFRPGAWNVTPEETVDLVRKLACEFDDAQIARILNKQGRRSGPGVPFTKASVAHLRRQHEVPAFTRKSVKDPREGPFTADEAAVQLGVSVVTVHRWLREGVLPGRQVTPGAPWQIVLGDDLRRKLANGEAPKGWVGLSEAAQRLGLSKSSVAHLVNTGKLPAVRTQVGKRSCWRIDVSSKVYAQQVDMLDQMSSAEREDS